MFCGLSVVTSRCNQAASIAEPIFTPTGLAMPRQYSTCAPSICAVRMPIHGMCVDRLYQRFWRGMKRGLRLLVMQHQRLVAGVELGAQRVVHFLGADGLEEFEAVRDRARRCARTGP
jgi:hypothetical protein